MEKDNIHSKWKTFLTVDRSLDTNCGLVSGVEVKICTAVCGLKECSSDLLFLVIIKAEEAEMS